MWPCPVADRHTDTQINSDLGNTCKATFVYDSEGNAVGVTAFYGRANNGGSSGGNATNLYVYAGTAVNEFRVGGTVSNRSYITELTYVPADESSETAEAFTYEQVRSNLTVDVMDEEGDHEFRIGFTTDAEGNILGINMFQYRPKTQAYFSHIGSASAARGYMRNKDGTWTLYVTSSISVTLSIAEGGKITITHVTK